MGLVARSGSANRTVGGDDLLSVLGSKAGRDFRLDFKEERCFPLVPDTDDALDSVLTDDRSETGVVVPLLVVE